MSPQVTVTGHQTHLQYLTLKMLQHGYEELDGALSITTTTIGSSTYALVTAFVDDGVQIINITNPAIPSPVANITDGDDYPILNGSRAITTVTLDSFTYALVARSFNDNGIQISTHHHPCLHLLQTILMEMIGYPIRGMERWFIFGLHHHQSTIWW